MSRTDLPAETLARSLRAVAGDGSTEWTYEPMQTSVLLDVADMLDENAKLRKLAVGMYGLLEILDKILGNHNACETTRPLIFGEDKSFKDVMNELELGVAE